MLFSVGVMDFKSAVEGMIGILTQVMLECY